MNSVIFILSLSGFVCGSILNDEFNDSNLDGEVAMKNLEAAQVKMEQKLETMTNFIDQELEKAKDSPVEERYTRRKRSAEDNPLLQIPQETVKRLVISVNNLNAAFQELQNEFLKHRFHKEEAEQAAEAEEPPAEVEEGEPPVEGEEGEPPVEGEEGEPPVEGEEGEPPVEGEEGEPAVEGEQFEEESELEGSEGGSGEPGSGSEPVPEAPELDSEQSQGSDYSLQRNRGKGKRGKGKRRRGKGKKNRIRGKRI